MDEDRKILEELKREIRKFKVQIAKCKEYLPFNMINLNFQICILQLMFLI